MKYKTQLPKDDNSWIAIVDEDNNDTASIDIETGWIFCEPDMLNNNPLLKEHLSEVSEDLVRGHRLKI